MQTKPYVDVISDHRVRIVNSKDNVYSLENTHSPLSCLNETCVLHNPSDHHLRHLPLNFRSDTTLFERICPHGIGHPDPDSLQYFIKIGHESLSVHGCDGCCLED